MKRTLRCEMFREKSAIRSRDWVIGVLALCVTAAHGGEPAPLLIASQDLTIELSREGQLSEARLGPRAVQRAIAGGTRLAGCQAAGDNDVTPLEGGGFRFTRKWAATDQAGQATVVESFRPTANSVRWEIEITGDGAPWSAPIETWLQWPAPAQSKLWTAWADSRPGGGPGWDDPLLPQPFADRQLNYVANALVDPDSFVVPLVTVLEEAEDLGLSLVQSPEDLVLDMKLNVRADGQLVFSRTNHRLEIGRPVKFAMDLVAHPADWRCGLGWMVTRYTPYFEPPNQAVHQLAGCGAYSSHTEITNPGHLMRMAFRVNWKASYDFPYMGMFLPPTNSDTEEWIDFKNQKNSIAGMREHSRQMQRMGFHVLNYFNVTECGAHYTDPPPPRKAAADADLWRDSNDFLFYQVGEAILPGADGKPLGSWVGCVAMDPGEPVYQEFLLEQARRHVEQLPESDGICIDRMDWLRLVNRRRDDGLSWVDGKPVRSLAVSWQQVSERLGRIMHDAGKVIYVNPLHAHLGWLRHVDGIYDEFGDYPACLNRSGLLGLRKPVMAWTRDAAAVVADPDAYFQRHLHLGSYLTAPVPGNDHTILPREDVDRFYLDYGPLLDSLRGKRWVLLPHVLDVVEDKAKANLFEVPGAYVIPVTFGQGERVTVVLRGLPRLAGQEGFRAEVVHPGQNEWLPLAIEDDCDKLTCSVPLVRGCAVVKLSSAWIDPQTTYFAETANVTMGTTLRDAVIRYTTDGSPPAATSTAYSEPLPLERTTLVRAAAFRHDQRLGDVLSVEFVPVPIDAPRFAPSSGGFDESMEVALIPPDAAAGGAIHYTLDGTPPSATSPRYTKPIRLTNTATVQAAVFQRGREGCAASATYYNRGPQPPQPDLHLSDLAPVRATTGWGDKPRMNRSIWDRPLSLGGRTYAKGVGVHAHSELQYELQPAYRRFVAVVGVDDGMKSYPQASIAFEVWVDDRRVEQTRIFRAGDYGYLNVEIPAGSKTIRLIVTDANDGVECDHADWAEAGFLLGSAK